jgi:single-strand DNA-binding protein
MVGYNRVVLMGNLTRDPELRFSAAGAPWAKTGMAMNHRWRDKNEQMQEEVTFVDITAFGKTAEVMSKYLKKGAPLLVDGRLQYQTWQTDAGEKRSKLQVVAHDMKFLPRREGPPGGGAPGGGAPGEYLADSASAHEDADGADPFDAPEPGGVMPSVPF